MAKNSVADWSTSASSNSDIAGVNVAEGCAPSGINDAVRNIMAQIATLDPVGAGANATITGAWTVTGSLDLSGATLTFDAGAIGTAEIADDAVTRAKIADAAMSGSDDTLITGTAGTDGNLASWNADGDLVDAGAALAGYVSNAVAVMSDTYTATTALSTAIPHDDTLPLVSEGTEVLSVASVAVASGQTVKLEFSGTATCATSGAIGTIALFRDSTLVAVTAFEQGASVNAYSVSITKADAPGAGTYTYSVRAGATTGNMYFNADFNGTRIYGGGCSADLLVSVR